MQYSKERLFQSCNLYNHCLLAYLKNPIKVKEQEIDEIYIINLLVSDKEFEILQTNIINSINTQSGNIKIKGFIDGGNPLEPMFFNIPLEDIYKIESTELR